jgi:nucleoside-diphosphate-sugar epimerase
LRGQPLEVHGDGTQSRDFTFIENVVDANILAGDAPDASGEAFNVGCGERTSLLEVIGMLESIIGKKVERRHTPSRGGDVPHTLADVAKAKRLMGYTPLVGFAEGFRRTVEHFKVFA